MKHILLGAALMGAMTLHPVAALAAGAVTELHSLQVSGVALTKTIAPIWSFTAGVSGTIMVVATGKDTTAGGSTTTYELFINSNEVQVWVSGDLYLTRTVPVRAGDKVTVSGFYKGGAGATLKAANFSAIIAQK